jgi:uncharacterized protein with von Willebrand factor type A (vWA) domain
MGTRYTYSQWDGTQSPFEELDTAFDRLSEEILEAGDVNEALRNLYAEGFHSDRPDPLVDGERGHSTGIRPVGGLKDLRRRLEELRRLNQEYFDLESPLREISEQLQDVVNTELDGIDRRLAEASEYLDDSSESERSSLGFAMDLLGKRAIESRKKLENLPESISESVTQLSRYGFMDSAARDNFEKLIETLSEQLIRSFFQHTKNGLGNLSKDNVEHIQNALDEINRMLRDRLAGEDEKFDEFINKFDDLFGVTGSPQRPSKLDDLIENLRNNFIAMHSISASLSDQMKDELSEILKLSIDPEMSSSLTELGGYIQEMSPFDGLIDAYKFSGSSDISLEKGLELVDEMRRINDLDATIREVMRSGRVADLDLDEVENLLGEEARFELEEVRRMVQALEEAGYLNSDRDRFTLGPSAVKQIAQKAMKEVFDRMKKDRFGDHEAYVSGDWGDLTGETLPYEPDSSFNINLQKSLFNTVKRQGTSIPLKMSYADLEINEHEHLTRSATVLLIDQSRSMGMYGTYTSAKKVALALYWLIKTKFPRDKFFVVGFSDYGMVIQGEDIAESTWNHWVAGTNMHHGLILARQLLARENAGNKQILMVTDGEPTCHMEGGQAYFSYPPSDRTLNQTLREVKRCTSEGIVINTFMLEENYTLMEFIDSMVNVNGGRAFYTNPDELGKYVLVDYVRGRRLRV